MPILPLVALLLPCGTWAQPEGRLGNQEARQLMHRMADLFESTQFVNPELSRAAAPLQENFRQGLETMETTGRNSHTGIVYKMLANARAYLHLADTLPRSADFSEEIDAQLGELRAAIRRLDGHFRATLEAREELARGSDRDNLRRYADANAQVGPPGQQEQRVVFLGDSITDGWKLNQYFSGKPYLNRGISGQITGQMLGRMKADVIDLQPAAVVVLGGTNDLARGVPDSTIRQNLETIGLLAEAAGVRPILASILPVNDYQAELDRRFRRTHLRSPSRIDSLNRWLNELCRSRRWTYLDYYQATVDADSRLQKRLSGDGLHPNAEGYKVMAPLAQKSIEAALAAQDGRSRRNR